MIIFKCFHSTHVFIGERIESTVQENVICDLHTLRYIKPKFLILEESFLFFYFRLFLSPAGPSRHKAGLEKKRKEIKKESSLGLNVERGSDTAGHTADEAHVLGSRGQPRETQPLRRVGDPEAGGACAAGAFFCFPCSAVQDPG